MITLSELSFHEVMAAHPSVACILHRGPWADADAFAMKAGAEPGAAPWTWASLDLAAAPNIGAMLGISGSGRQLLVMRDQVVLYCDEVPAAPVAAMSILDRAARLDMAQVHAELAQERAGRAALFGRRVCPTAWRKR